MSNHFNKGQQAAAELIAAESLNITYDATLARFLQGKRIVATGDRNGFTAVSLEDYPGYEVLSSMPVTERPK